MARFITIISALFINYMLFEATGQPCSSAGITGLTGCECNFLGACNARGKTIPGLNILNHLPKGLELYANVRDVRSGKNMAFLCEGNVVAIRYDCNNRIPLYAATIVTGKQLAAAQGHRPTGSPGTFRESGTGLDEVYQQNTHDYDKALEREIRYVSTQTIAGTRKRKMLTIDPNWKKPRYSAKKPLRSSRNLRVGKKAIKRPLLSGRNLKVGVHRGHMIASNFGAGDFARKVQTFVYTNAVPQFARFNSGSWKTFEGKLIRWGRDCLYEGTSKSANAIVKVFIVVGAIPSTFPPGNTNTRFFGSGGFSKYQDDRSYRVNFPKQMWTASCCTIQYTKKGHTYLATRSTAYWGKNVPISQCNGFDVDTLEKNLTPRGETRINLFPFSNECKEPKNFRRLP